jgi:hypothetical protein
MALRRWRRSAIVVAAIVVLAGAGRTALDRWIDATRSPTGGGGCRSISRRSTGAIWRN